MLTPHWSRRSELQKLTKLLLLQMPLPLLRFPPLYQRRPYELHRYHSPVLLGF